MRDQGANWFLYDVAVENYNLKRPNECFHFSIIVYYTGGRDNMLISSVHLLVHPRVLLYRTYNLHSKGENEMAEQS